MCQIQGSSAVLDMLLLLSLVHGIVALHPTQIAQMDDDVVDVKAIVLQAIWASIDYVHLFFCFWCFGISFGSSFLVQCLL